MFQDFSPIVLAAWLRSHPFVIRMVSTSTAAAIGQRSCGHHIVCNNKQYLAGAFPSSLLSGMLAELCAWEDRGTFV